MLEQLHLTPSAPLVIPAVAGGVVSTSQVLELAPGRGPQGRLRWNRAIFTLTGPVLPGVAVQLACNIPGLGFLNTPLYAASHNPPRHLPLFADSPADASGTIDAVNPDATNAASFWFHLFGCYEYDVQDYERMPLETSAPFVQSTTNLSLPVVSGAGVPTLIMRMTAPASGRGIRLYGLVVDTVSLPGRPRIICPGLPGFGSGLVVTTDGFFPIYGFLEPGRTYDLFGTELGGASRSYSFAVYGWTVP